MLCVPVRLVCAGVHSTCSCCRGEYCTVSLDGTIRGWSVQTHQQLFELAAPGEIIQCCAYHPDRHELACGFGQGRVRIFNLDDTTLLREHKQHRSTVLQVLYLPSGKLLFSMGERLSSLTWHAISMAMTATLIRGTSGL